MARTVIGPEEGAELTRLYQEKEDAVRLSNSILRTRGMDSPEFFAAHEAEIIIDRRIKEILGTTDKHWME